MGPEEQEGQQAGAHWSVVRSGRNTVVTLSGEIDLAAVRGPTEGILGAIRSSVEGDALVICDMSQVAYMDSSGFHFLVRIKDAVERTNGRFVVSRPSDRVRQLLRIAGVEEFFDIQD